MDKTQNNLEEIRYKNLMNVFNNLRDGQSYVMLSEVNAMLAEIKEKYTPNSQIKQSNEKYLEEALDYAGKRPMLHFTKSEQEEAVYYLQWIYDGVEEFEQYKSKESEGDNANN